MRQRPLSVLLVEHDPETLQALGADLEVAADPPLEIERVGELAGALERLSRGGIDVVLLDLDLPDSRGLATFERANAFAPDVPIVVLTENDAENVALATVQGGAQDHLVRKDATPAVLARALRYAVERHRLVSALKSLSLIDDLTGLYNRRGFTDLGEQYLKLARRNKRDVTLVLVDVDRFKTINDGLGHHVGDRALMKVADILRATFRRSDIMGRLEADVFAVLALEASEEAAEMLARRVQERIQECNRQGYEPYQLSTSIALARTESDEAVHLSVLLEEAEVDLRDVKRRKAVGTP